MLTLKRNRLYTGMGLTALLVLLLTSFIFGYRCHSVRVAKAPPPGAPHLNRYEHFTNLMRSREIEAELVHYAADFDQTIQSVLILRPFGKVPKRLFFFFHGMNGDAGDAVVAGDLVARLDAMVVAPGGREAAWISDAFLSDAGQVIRTYSGGFGGFYLIGISMGGTQALALPGLVAPQLSESIRGVVALLPGSDLDRIASESSNEGVRQTLRQSVNGDRLQLKQRSPREVLSRYPKGLPLTLFYQLEDEILPPPSLREFIDEARDLGHPVSVFSDHGNHSFLFSSFDYAKVFEALGKDFDSSGTPLR